MYWRSPFEALATLTDLVEFTVLDIEPSGPTKGKLVLADAQVAVSGAFTSSGAAADDDMDYDEGTADNKIYHTRTCASHLRLYIAAEACRLFKVRFNPHHDRRSSAEPALQHLVGVKSVFRLSKFNTRFPIRDTILRKYPAHSHVISNFIPAAYSPYK